MKIRGIALLVYDGDEEGFGNPGAGGGVEEGVPIPGGDFGPLLGSVGLGDVLGNEVALFCGGGAVGEDEAAPGIGLLTRVCDFKAFGFYAVGAGVKTAGGPGDVPVDEGIVLLGICFYC